jgi:hypothetical protein
MATPAESANLILRLYEQRREATMREARNFMVTFDPRSFDELIAGIMGDHSAHIRMVLSYWDMAASLVLNGAIDSKMFVDANQEFILVFSRVEPYLAQLREANQNPHFLKSLEQFTLSIPDARQRIDNTREMIRKVMAMRAANG